MKQLIASLSKLLAWVCLSPIFFLDVILSVVSFSWLRLKKRPMQSVEHGSATELLGTPRRSVKKPDKLLKGDIGTIYEMVQQAIKDYGDSVAMASRTFVGTKKLEETDRFPTKIYDDSKLEEITYKEFNENLLNFGAGLRKIGMEPIPEPKQGQSFDDLTGSFVMVIFEDTCKQWTTAMQGAMSQSITVATCYATLGEDAVVGAVNETGATVLLLNWKNAEKFATIAKKMPTLKTIIASTNEMPKGTQVSKVPAGSTLQEIVTTDEILKLGKQHRGSFVPVPPKPSDVAVIMYTSGSTGKPKGVIMKHSQLVAGVTGMTMDLQFVPGKERYVSYLPLAHILALQVEHGLLRVGAKLCYSDPRELAKVLPIFKPTVFAGVPAVWNRLIAALEGKLADKPTFKLIFDSLLKWKLFSTKYIMNDTRMTNRFFHLISKKVFGGVLRFGVSGGGPIHYALLEKCRAVFCCPLVQGYALTETCVGGCIQSLDDPRSSIVGPPVPCVEICLQSEPDVRDSAGTPYLHTDRKSSKGEPILGRGEICMRGPSISSGYYKLHEKTKAEYDEDGWFHTGDIGQFTSDGVIQIVDRKKNIVKLRGGEYVAVESMESAFGQSLFVKACCVVANGDIDAPFVIVSVDGDYLKIWARAASETFNDLDDLLARDAAREAVIKSLILKGEAAGLSKLELRVKDCCIVGKEWLPGSGMTASMKLDRRAIFNMHQEDLKQMLKRNGLSPSVLGE